jgi:hypothetical protein
MVNVGVQMNQFGFIITGTSNLVVVVDACRISPNPCGNRFEPTRSPTRRVFESMTSGGESLRYKGGGHC